MKEIRLGRTELTVSRIAFGTWQLGGDWGATDEDAAISAIRRAADDGVTLFDTAQGYGFGASERLLARALGSRLQGSQRGEVFIATKGGLRSLGGSKVVRDSSAASIRQSIEASLEALGTHYIDIYQLHWPDPNTPIQETADALAKAVADGKIRHVGVSNFDLEQMEVMSRSVQVETLQPPYHLFRRDIEESILPYTKAHDIGVLVYGSLAHGLLTGALKPDQQFPPGDWRSHSPVFSGESYQHNLEVVARLEELARDELGVSVSRLATAWTLANPAVHVAIVGTRNAEHVDDAVAAADLELSEHALRHIDAITAEAIPVGGPYPELM
jgi:aryl-alcohol dehydrogenase-like predicted oxidoreductase